MVFYKVPQCRFCYPFRFWFGYTIPLIMPNNSWLAQKHFLDTQKRVLQVFGLHNMWYYTWIRSLQTRNFHRFVHYSEFYIYILIVIINTYWLPNHLDITLMHALEFIFQRKLCIIQFDLVKGVKG